MTTKMTQNELLKVLDKPEDVNCRKIVLERLAVDIRML
jgi:hypothetical protein